MSNIDELSVLTKDGKKTYRRLLGLEDGSGGDSETIGVIQATFDRNNESVILTDETKAVEILKSGKPAIIELLVDNSFESIYTKDINNNTNGTYRFSHAELGYDSHQRGYTGTDIITIVLDDTNETVDSVTWNQVYNVTHDNIISLVHGFAFGINNETIPAQGSRTLTLNNISPMVAGKQYKLISYCPMDSCSPCSIGQQSDINIITVDNNGNASIVIRFTNPMPTDAQGYNPVIIVKCLEIE